MQKLLKSFFGQTLRSRSRSGQARKRSSDRSAQIGRSSGAEVLENRTLLAAQMVGSDATSRIVTGGEVIEVPVTYRTLDDSNDPAALRATLISFNLHFDSDVLS
ncbi:MAG: hypothetical protein ABGZ53_24820, partial [Fuerstiella sp.]